MSTGNAAATLCGNCPLRALASFRPFSPEELSFMKVFKRGELKVDAGATVIAENSVSLNLYTVLAGTGFRYKMLEDGRRQILNFLLPGDLAGLQGTMAGEMQHSVEAMSAMTLCVFDKRRLDTLFQSYPGLAYDLTWIAAREERLLDENLLSIGRRTAEERVAFVLSMLHFRASQLGLAKSGRVGIPINQQHLADTLGLSLVHTNKTLARLVRKGLARWLERGGFEILHAEKLATLGGWRKPAEAARPFL
jgi:CRP-like cAMP-binding protein